jgi:hypothetical protein
LILVDSEAAIGVVGPLVEVSLVVDSVVAEAADSNNLTPGPMRVVRARLSRVTPSWS